MTSEEWIRVAQVYATLAASCQPDGIGSHPMQQAGQRAAGYRVKAEAALRAAGVQD